MSSRPISFDKYDEKGAYHWVECDRTSAQYNPPLDARYGVLVRRIEKAGRILDLGCGDGYLMSLVSPLSDSVVGIDSEPSAVSIAARKLKEFPNCTVVRGTSDCLPYADGSFDVVLLADVIEHLESPERCLQEIGRVLAPNGTLLVTTPKWLPDRMWDQRHVKEYTPEEFEASLMREFSSVTMSFFWPMVWSRMYSTRAGWRLIRVLARYLFNPFLRESAVPGRYGQMLAVAQRPRLWPTSSGVG